MFTDKNNKIAQTIIIAHLLFCLIFTRLLFGFSQIEFPLSNTNGIPFYKDHIDYSIEGFDIDSAENFYFNGQVNSVIVKMTKDKKVLFRKKYPHLLSNTIHIAKNCLFVFDNKRDSIKLFKINPRNGNVLSAQFYFVKKSVPSFLFQDTSIIGEVMDINDKSKPARSLGFQLFDLNGNFLKQASNRYDLPPLLYPDKFENAAVQFLGKYKESYLFWGYDGNEFDNFWLENEKGDTLSIAHIKTDSLGKVYFGNPNEHRKLRNGKIYILGRKGMNALITILPVVELFPSLYKKKSTPDIDSNKNTEPNK